MASSKLWPSTSTLTSGVLPPDALFEVLLLLPAKELCRLRTVCRSWCVLTSDPHFVAAHKSLHAEPLFAVPFSEGDAWGVAIVGLSGHVLRRIRFGFNHIEVLRTHIDRICVTRWCKPSSATWVVNPATGVALTLPGLHSDEFVGRCREDRYDWGLSMMHNCKTVTYAFGQVASTGDYKVLRIRHPDASQPQLCDIMTLDRRSHGSWREKQSPPGGLIRGQGTMDCLAVNGVVYFLFESDIKEPGSIAPFNLDAEEWMPTLRGPEPLRNVVFRCFDRIIALANLNDCLVTVDNFFGVSFDLWFLMDRERSIWDKRYRLSIKQNCYYSVPLLVLDDGRIVIYEWMTRLLQCYDRTTGNLTTVLNIGDVGLGQSPSIAVYTGSLLI
ncbi:hypothetical protein ACP70R_010335 [Stipagrostis hirtigluma subsp. patula]